MSFWTWWRAATWRANWRAWPQTITGSTLRPRPVAFKAAIAQSLRTTVWPLLASGRIQPVIYRVFPAAEAAQAHTLMESNQHIGKLVLTWS